MHRRLVPSVLVALSCVLLIGAAAPAAGALTRDAQTRQNVRLLKVYIERYTAGRSFVYPAASIVRKGGGLASPVWPTNPWTGKPMAPGTSRGDYTYAVDSTHVVYSLTGWLPGGRFKLTGRVPSWLQEERDTASAEISMLEDQLDDAQSDLTAAQQAAADAQAALAPTRKQAAELGARLIRSYVEQWGMLNNATAPSADKVSKTGAIGLSFPYWPDDPYTGSPMTPGGQQGGYLYSPGSGGAYSMSANTGAAMPVTLDGTVPQQLTNALTATRDEYVKASMYYLQGAIDRYAYDSNGLFPDRSLVNESGLNDYAFDYWPANPWFAATAMSPGTGRGTYTYSLGGSHGYTLAGHLSDGTDYTVDGFWGEWKLGFRDRMKNMALQAQGQVLREYVEEWKAAHAGAPPTLDQMTKTGAVGALHAWWPLNPWMNAPMADNDVKGDFQYAVGDGNTYTLTVRQQPISDYQPYFTQYYTPE